MMSVAFVISIIDLMASLLRSNHCSGGRPRSQLGFLASRLSQLEECFRFFACSRVYRSRRAGKSHLCAPQSMPSPSTSDRRRSTPSA